MYSPTVSYQALRVIIAITCLLGLQLHQMDMKTAFLNGIIDKELFIEQPEGFEEHGKPREDFICKLNKALYGLKQAGRLWYYTLHEHLEKNGYKRLETEPCVYIHREGEKIIIIAVYVDDINIASNDDVLLRSEERRVGKECRS